MPASPYFRHAKNSKESELFSDLVAEAIALHGIDVKYVKRQYQDVNILLAEVRQSQYNHAYDIEMYDNTQGQGFMTSLSMDPWGIVAADRIELVVSVKRWEQSVAPHDAELSRPREGDLVAVGDFDAIEGSYMAGLYQILAVRQGFPDKQQFGGMHAYQLTCDVYTASFDDANVVGENALNDLIMDNFDSSQINDALENVTAPILVRKKNPFSRDVK